MVSDKGYDGKDVALFIDPLTDKTLLRRISSQMAVWISHSPHNRLLVEELWKTPVNPITIFDVPATSPPIDAATCMKQVLGEHHAQMTNLFVFGLSNGAELDPRWNEDGLAFIKHSLGAKVFECDPLDFE